MDKRELEVLVRQFLQQKLRSGVICAHPVKQFTQADRLETGDSSHRVFTHDLFTLSESPRLGVGWMEMTATTFPWELDYDEVDFIEEGELTILCGETATTAQKGDVLLIPKGSKIQFSAPGYAKFLYVTYPADWKQEG